jgi:hypothetical protein
MQYKSSLLTTVGKLQSGESTSLKGIEMITHGSLPHKCGQLFWSDEDLWYIQSHCKFDGGDSLSWDQSGTMDSGEVESPSQ